MIVKDFVSILEDYIDNKDVEKKAEQCYKLAVEIARGLFFDKLDKLGYEKKDIEKIYEGAINNRIQ